MVDPRRLHVPQDAADPRTGAPEQDLAALLARRWKGLAWGYGLADGLAHPFNMAQALYYGACTHLYRREALRVAELAAALMELCRVEGFSLLVAGGMVLHGWSMAERGEVSLQSGPRRNACPRWPTPKAPTRQARPRAGAPRSRRKIRRAAAA